MPLTSWVLGTTPTMCFPQPRLARGPSCLLLSGPFLSLGVPTGRITPVGPGTHTHLGWGPLLCASPPGGCAPGPQHPCPPSPLCAGPRVVCGSSGGSGPPSAQWAQASKRLPRSHLFPTTGDRPKPLTWTRVRRQPHPSPAEPAWVTVSGLLVLPSPLLSVFLVRGGS